ncbi:MAG: 50S ribosomal protein L3 [Dethiobacteria bacterium]|nr:50S ribosomal protein L3 [Bacillota bacterium]MDW7729427.1 50S ribosomal protein L3 [Bacillota bacterium]
MTKAILARKVGMTQIYDEQGRVVPVTVLEAGPCRVVQVKSTDTDGYNSIQLGFVEKKEQRVNRPMKGHFQKAKVKPLRFIREFKVEDTGQYKAGQEIKADSFSAGDYVDVSAVARGKGFAGSIKKMGFSRGPKTHGSHYHRGPGSLGSVAPARVFKGRRLPGRMGGWRRTIQRLLVVDSDAGKNLLLVKGSVPGPRGGLIEIKESVKSR